MSVLNSEAITVAIGARDPWREGVSKKASIGDELACVAVRPGHANHTVDLIARIIRWIHRRLQVALIGVWPPSYAGTDRALVHAEISAIGKACRGLRIDAGYVVVPLLYILSEVLVAKDPVLGAVGCGIRLAVSAWTRRPRLNA